MMGFLARSLVALTAVSGMAHLARSGDELPAAPVASTATHRVPIAANATQSRSAPAISSLLSITRPLRHGEHLWDESGRAVRGPLWIRIDRDKQILSVFRGGHEIGTAVILYGAEEKPTPAGRFAVRARIEHHRSSLYDAPMPYTLRLTDDGISIHGSEMRAGAATHGCIGLPLEFARRLFREVRVGDAVVIV